MDYSKYIFTFGHHRKKEVVFIQFPYDKALIDDLRKRFPSAKWSRSQKSWYLPDIPSVREALKLPRQEWGRHLLPKIHPVNAEAFQAYINQLVLKAYSPRTIEVYISEFAHLLILLKHHPVNELNEERLKDYFLYCVKKERIKESQLNSRINGVKFYFEKVLHKDRMFFDIPRPKSPKTLPKTLSKAEIKKIFKCTNNPKHLLMLKLAYGMGLRVSEIVNLKLEHINSNDMLVRIEGAKGKKDRYTNLPKSVVGL